MHHCKKGILITGIGCLCVLTLPVGAANNLPSAGAILQNPGYQEQFNVPKTPSIEVAKEQQPQTVKDGGTKVFVKKINITGQSAFAKEKLEALCAPAIGKEMTFSELNQEAAKVTNYFTKHGYPFASAYFPPQEVTDGQVEMRIMTGKYGTIITKNNSRLRNSVVHAYFSNLQQGEDIKQGKLERDMLLMNDVRGVTAKGTLSKGATTGTADLTIEINDSKPVNGQVYVDNWGSRYTGHNRIGTEVYFNDITRNGDYLGMGGTYAGTGMNDYNFMYVLPLGGDGVTAGVSYSKMSYELSKEFADLDGEGNSWTTSAWMDYPIKRSRKTNLHATLTYNRRQLKDDLGLYQMDNRKHSQSLVYALRGDSHDTLGGGGMNTFSLSYTSGHLGLDTEDAVYNDLYGTAGNYGKKNLYLSRIQMLNKDWNLFLSFNGQLANKNLDSSEKLQVGGPTGVRAYPIGNALGDEGFVFTGELRYKIPKTDFQIVPFYDLGKVKFNHDPRAGVDNTASMSDLGLGLIWQRENNFYVRMDCAWSITAPEVLGTDVQNAHNRIWVQAVKFF